jgi:hypothetical protein
MSQSKDASGAKAKPAKAQTTKGRASAAVKGEETATVRVIPAPQPVALPDASLTPAEKARTLKAKELAADIERALKAGERAVVLDPEGVQDLMAALCKVYSAHVDLGERYDAFSHTNPVTPTDVMVTASGLLKAANLAVFELGMWQSWTGR